MIDNILKNTHPEWHDILTQALLAMDKKYLGELGILPTPRGVCGGARGAADKPRVVGGVYYLPKQ
ncbi:MAG: hypothetical protein QNK11_03140, partial [Legionella sp.]|nr:hypothetical protein [Legionella sp.]